MAQPGLGPLFDVFRRLGLVDAGTNWFASKSSALFVVILSVRLEGRGHADAAAAGRPAVDPGRGGGGRGNRRRQALADDALRHAAAAAAHARAGARVLGGRLAAGVRPVLHHDQRRAEQLDDHRRLPDLPDLVRPVPPGLRGGTVGAADGGARRRQRHPVAAAAQHGARMSPPHRRIHHGPRSDPRRPGAPARRPRRVMPKAAWWAVSIAFAVMFIFPIYVAISSSLKTPQEARRSADADPARRLVPELRRPARRRELDQRRPQHG